MILREEEAAYFEAITMLLKAGRSPKAILDAIQVASIFLSSSRAES